MTRLLFQHGRFTADDAARTSGILVAYGVGVWAYCGIPVLYRGFYAVGERNVPVRLGLCAVGLDLALNLSLIWLLAERGLALSTAISASLQVALLAWLIQGRVGRLDWAHIGATAARALVATAAMSTACLAALWLIPPASSTAGEAAVLAIPILLAVITYFAVARWLGLEELGMLLMRDRGTDDCS